MNGKPGMPPPLLLLTNDDGVNAPGLAAVAEALTAVGEVQVYAPDRNQSAVGHGVSLHKPLRVNQLREGCHMVDGTPADCVMLAIRDLLGRRPDIVISGINRGANLGDDVTYSGTVAGAFEGMLLGVPSFAVSDVSYSPKHVETAARFSIRLCEHILAHALPADTMLNVNVPDLPYESLAGVSITRQGRRDYQDEIIKRTDPRGDEYFWIGGAAPTHEVEPGTDFEAIENNKISITPLHRDLTHHAALQELQTPEITC